MKAKEVRAILGVTQKTINTYIKNGVLHPTIVNTHHYEYDDDEVYSLVNKNGRRLTVTYARVSNPRQKEDLTIQNERLYDYALRNGYGIDEQIQDVKSGLNTKDRKGFLKLIDMVSKREVKCVIIEQPDRLCRFGFDAVKEMFAKNGAEIVVMSSMNNRVYDKELKEDIMAVFADVTEQMTPSEKERYIVAAKAIKGKIKG